jgi:tripartite-type tricarboxylate transporter receptor subunit TctC
MVRIFVCWFAALACIAGFPALAQEFPARTVTIVFPGAPGGEPDRIARMLADQLRQKWGRPVVVENRAGAGGNIGAEFVANAPADGHTLLFTGAGTLAISKSIYSRLGYDPDALVPVSVVVSTPMVLVANNDVPFKTLPELIAYAKANPDKLNYASAGNGTTTHLTGELLKSMAGIRLVHVPYKGLAPALTDLLGKQVDLLFMDIGSALPNIRAGKLRALAITTKERSALLPDLPPVADVVPGFDASFSFVLVAPPRTPAAIAAKLADAVAEGMHRPEVSKSLLEHGTVVVAGTAAAAGVYLAQERERWTRIVRMLGIKAD